MSLAVKPDCIVRIRVEVSSTNAIIFPDVLYGKYPTYLNHCILTMGCMQIALSVASRQHQVTLVVPILYSIVVTFTVVTPTLLYVR